MLAPLCFCSIVSLDVRVTWVLACIPLLVGGRAEPCYDLSFLRLLVALEYAEGGNGNFESAKPGIISGKTQLLLPLWVCIVLSTSQRNKILELLILRFYSRRATPHYFVPAFSLRITAQFQLLTPHIYITQRCKDGSYTHLAFESWRAKRWFTYYSTSNYAASTTPYFFQFSHLLLPSLCERMQASCEVSLIVLPGGNRRRYI